MQQKSPAVQGPLDGGVGALVERLRADVLWHQRRGNETIARDCQDAADAIERLRGMLAEAYPWIPGVPGTVGDYAANGLRRRIDDELAA